MSLREMRQKIKEKSFVGEQLYNDFESCNNPVEYKKLETEEYVLLSDVLVLLGDAEKQLREKLKSSKVSILEMFCYQGPPTKRWIETKGQFWEGWNASLEKIIEKILGVDSEKKE